MVVEGKANQMEYDRKAIRVLREQQCNIMCHCCPIENVDAQRRPAIKATMKCLQRITDHTQIFFLHPPDQFIFRLATTFSFTIIDS